LFIYEKPGCIFSRTFTFCKAKSLLPGVTPTRAINFLVSKSGTRSSCRPQCFWWWGLAQRNVKPG